MVGRPPPQTGGGGGSLMATCGYGGRGWRGAQPLGSTDGEPGRPKGVSKSVGAGRHHGAGAGVPYWGTASLPPPSSSSLEVVVWKLGVCVCVAT